MRNGIKQDYDCLRWCVQAPAFLVALFGLYSVVSLAYGVITFRTVPEEASLLREVWVPAHTKFVELSCRATVLHVFSVFMLCRT